VDLGPFSRHSSRWESRTYGSWLYSHGHYTVPFLHRAGRIDKAALKRDLRRSSARDIDG